MTQNAAKLLAEALCLSEKERGELAVRLIESLDSLVEEDAETAWSAEIQNRLGELQAGQIQPIPRPEARRMIAEDTD